MLNGFGRHLLLALVLLFAVAPSWAQSGSSGSIGGVVKDPSGGVVANATVEISDAVSGYTRTTTTGSDGAFRFTNVPFNTYHTVVTAAGFANYTSDVDVRSAVPAKVEVSLKVGSTATVVTVEANGGDLVEDDPTTHTDVDRALFDKLPLESTSSSLSSLVTLASPGVAADSNGLFHGFGDHASNSFSIDGQPITDQQSKVFSNQLPVDAVQSLEVIEGAPPAEFGGKTSLVIVATTRSGLGVTEPHGVVTSSYGTFGTVNSGFNFSYGGDKWGDFISANGLNTGRFLDGPEYVVMHDKGNEENLFDRVDYKLSSADTLSLNIGYSRSWFQTPNSFDAEDATGWSFNAVDPVCPPGQSGSCGGLGPNGVAVGPQDQRSKIGTFNVSPSWTRLINPQTVFTLGGWVRRDQYNYYPSANPFADLTPDLQQETVAQNRSLLNGGGRGVVSYDKGINNIKAGVTYEQTFLDEHDHFGIVGPSVNPVCLNADGSPDTNPTVTSFSQCTGPLFPNNAANNVALGATVLPFTPILGCYDLTRIATLPASDGCPAGQTTSDLYTFNGHTDIKETALTPRTHSPPEELTLNLGKRRAWGKHQPNLRRAARSIHR